jgi:hypothetical protein
MRGIRDGSRSGLEMRDSNRNRNGDRRWWERMLRTERWSAWHWS